MSASLNTFVWALFVFCLFGLDDVCLRLLVYFSFVCVCLPLFAVVDVARLLAAWKLRLFACLLVLLFIGLRMRLLFAFVALLCADSLSVRI